MKIYEFGDKNKPSIILFPGTCCYWKTNFGHVLDGLQEHFHTLVVSYSGFDDTENSTFISELDEVQKVENYIKDKLDGKLFAAYGCSLGGSFVSLLIGRQNIHIDHGQRKWNKLFIHIQGVHEESVLHRPIHKRWRTHKRTRNDYPRILRQENG